MLGPSAATWDDNLSTISDPHGRFLALACSENKFAMASSNSTIAIPDQATCQQLRILQGGERTRILKFGENSRTIASAGVKFVRVWDLSTATQTWAFEITQRCLALEFSSSNHLLFGAFADNSLKTWNFATGQAEGAVSWFAENDGTSPIPAYQSPSFASICTESSLLATLYRGRDAILWDLEDCSVYGTCSRDGEDIKNLAPEERCMGSHAWFSTPFPIYIYS